MSNTTQSQDERDRSLDEIKKLIFDNFKYQDIRIVKDSNFLIFDTKFGKINIPNSAIEYYYTIFNDTIQKIRKYEGYIDRIDKILQDKSQIDLCKELKEIIDWFNFSEISSENYSVVSQWLADSTITKEMMSKLYYSYSNDVINGLDENLLSKFTHSIKKSLTYYSILLKMFDIFDENIFDR
jgi:hypothetical protein